MPNKESGYCNVIKYCYAKKLPQLPFAVYVNCKSSFEKQDNCENDPQNSYNRIELSTIELSNHAVCRFYIFIKFSHDDSQNKLFLLLSLRLFRYIFCYFEVKSTTYLTLNTETWYLQQLKNLISTKVKHVNSATYVEPNLIIKVETWSKISTPF